MPQGAVRKAEGADAVFIGSNLRKHDFDELYGMTGRNPLQLVVESFRRSLEVYTVFKWKNEEPVAIFGVVPFKDDQIGVPWMVATDQLLTIKKEFVRASPHWINKLQRRFELLVNYVDQRNTVSIFWLKHMNFKFIRTLKIGPFALPVYEFARLR